MILPAAHECHVETTPCFVSLNQEMSVAGVQLVHSRGGGATTSTFDVEIVVGGAGSEL